METIEELDSSFKLSTLVYPEDLGNNPKYGHYVNFYIHVPEKSEYVKDGVAQNKTDLQDIASGNSKNVFGTSAVSSIKSKTDSYIENKMKDVIATSRADSIIKDKIGGGIFGLDLEKGLGWAMTGGKTSLSDIISLYMPSTVSTSQHAVYGNHTLVGELGKLASDVIGALVPKQIKGQDPTSLAGKAGSLVGGASRGAQAVLGSNIILDKAGLATNPVMQVIFNDMGFRQFQFTFFFTPSSRRESDSIKKIIQMFKFHQCPELDDKKFGLYYRVPSTFDIEYMFQGQRNKNLNKIASCVLTTVHVDYSPHGWTSYEDGMPVQTMMILQFQEKELMTKQRIKDGY